MKIFDFSQYKEFLKLRNKALPSHGRGELTRIAKALGIHTTMVSHILGGNAHLTMEQTLKLTEYLGFNAIETEYLVALVQWERAGDERSKTFWAKRIEELKSKALSLNRRLSADNQLSEQVRATYYSSWTYPMIRLCTAITRLQTIEALAEELRLSKTKIREVLDFLVANKLCLEKNGRYTYGPISTYLESTSPLIARHH